MRMISSWISSGWAASCCSSWVCGHHLGVVLERLRNALLVGRGQHALASAICVKVKDEAASMIAPANASPKDSPNDPAAEFASASH